MPHAPQERPKAPPTDDEMRHAWTQCRRRHWPPTLEATLAVPLLRGIVKLNAVLIRVRERKRAGTVDCKRAAAADRDD